MAIELKDIVLLVFGGGLGFFVSVAANIVSGPLLYNVQSYAAIRLLARIPLLRDKTFLGAWEISWGTTSTRFPPQNVASTVIHTAGSLTAFEATFVTTAGPILYRFVGKNRRGVISGRWFDPRSNDAYHGNFQIVRSGTLNDAEGLWIGFSSDQGVKSGPLQIRRTH